MSGPKHFEWSVNPEILENMRRNRVFMTEEQEKYWTEIAELNEGIALWDKKFKALKSRLNSMELSILAEAKKLSVEEQLTDKYQNAAQAIRNKLEGMNINTHQIDIPSKQAYIRKLESKYRDISEEMEVSLAEEHLETEKETLKRESTVLDKLSGLKRVQADGLENVSFQNRRRKQSEDPFEEPDWEAYPEEAGQAMQALENNLFVLPKEQEELDNAVQSIQRTANDTGIKGRFKKDLLDMKLDSLKHQINIIQSKEKERRKRREETLALYAKYAALCSALEIQPKDFNQFAIQSDEQEQVQLKEEIVRLQSEINRRDEQDYVSECVREAMQEMGHEVLFDDVFRENNAEVGRAMYAFRENSAVNVYTSENGSVMFEVVGIDQAARAPGVEEQQSLVEDMGSFCTEYDIIKQKLAQKGISANNEVKLPPDRQFAKIVEAAGKQPRKEQNKKRKKAAGKNSAQRNLHRDFSPSP
jgi:hypothetical protein